MLIEKYPARLVLKLLVGTCVFLTGAAAYAGTLWPGDMDLDMDVDFDDIDPFVYGLNDPEGYEKEYGVSPELIGDMDSDGDQDFDDIPCFAGTLQGGGCNPSGAPLPMAVWPGLVMLGLLACYRTIQVRKAA